MKKSKLNVEKERHTTQDQTEAHLFVGEFICEFANLEMATNNAITSYFTVDVTLNSSRKEEVFSKNESITSIMEYSVLGSPYFNFQMKIEMIKAIMQERTTSLYAIYGGQLFSLVDKIQKTRNLIAHFQTYVYEGDIYISKPKAKFKITKGDTKKGGIVPEPKGEYETIYEQVIITPEIKNKIVNQIRHITLIITFHSLSQDSIFPKETTKVTLENLLEMKEIYNGGVNDIGIIK